MPQTSYIHPRIDGTVTGYFDWIGAAFCSANLHTSAMHGKQFVLEGLHAGIDENNLYGRLDFVQAGQENEQVAICPREQPFHGPCRGDRPGQLLGPRLVDHFHRVQPALAGDDWAPAQVSRNRFHFQSCGHGDDP